MGSTRTEQTRERILHATRELLEAKGYRAVGMEAIGAAAGVTRQSVYLHFGSKTNLLLELVAEVDRQEGLQELSAAVREAETARDALDRFVDLVATLTPRVLAVAIALDAARRDHPEPAPAWQDRMASRRRTCRYIAKRLHAEGLLAEPWSIDDATDLLWSLTGIATWEALVIDSGWSPRRFRTKLRMVLHNALLVRND